MSTCQVISIRFICISGGISDEVDESFTVEMVESTIESQLECQICKRLMSDSKSLPCLHSFCAICLLKPAMTDGLIICPTCNLSTKATVTDYVSHQLVTNPPVLQLQKYHKTLKTTRSVACANCILPSIHFCFDCGDLKCEVHSLPAYHREDHRLVGRKVLVDKTELKREIYRLCPAHGQEFQQFCQTCCLSICSHHECKQKHKIHGDMRDLQATIEGCAVDIKEVRRLLEEKNQLVTAKLKLLQRNQLSVAEIQQHMKDSIEKYFEEITLGLEKLKLKYQADLDAATSECLTRDEKAVESLTQSTEKSQLLCSQTEIKIKPSEMSASPITELLSLRSKLSHQLRDSSTGALLVDPLGISYPEGRLRSLNQSIAIMTSDIKVLTVPKTWETAVTIAGLQRMSVDGQYIFVLNTGKGRLLFGGYCVRRFNLINGPNPSESISVLEHSMISLIGFTVGPNGQLAVLEQPQHNLELATWRVHRSVNLVIFSRKGGEYEALGNKILIDQLNHYDTSIIIKWKSPNLFISDSTCVCEYKPDGALLRKFNFHSLMDVTDFYYDQPYDLLYVTDKTKNCLMVFDSRQHVVKAVGEPGVLPGKFLNPTGVIRDGLGHLFIADTANRRVQVFSLDGTFLKMIPFPSSIKDIPVADGEHTHLDISDHFLYLHHSNTDTVWRLKYC